ncbi:MAG: aminotransferase class I/II-fold pyridoxal phosphate-dependent enzyme [bacterium]|nr:aminotransferase class I/II-fold pyridoxal phosphate-dependent enzyme [bacterium]
MELEFGTNVYEQARTLQAQGRDVNQIAKILCDHDPDGHNYGIGIVLDGRGQPAVTSSTLLEYSRAELDNSTLGTYMNSNKILEEVKIATLQWQRIPERYWGQFKLALPSDAGTGAVKSAVEIALTLNPALNTLGVEELGWPAYKAVAKVSRLGFQEFATGEMIDGDGVLPIYQAGPMNTSGLVQDKKQIQARAKAAADSSSYVVLDRAYPGFEFARLLGTHSYDDVMRLSCEVQIQPFIEAGVPFAMATGPTKAFVTFALRPCGLLLIFCPDASASQSITTAINTTIRARGSAFEHPVTRAFAKAMVKDRARLEGEHQQALERLGHAEASWRELVQGTAIEYLYAENYAGLFRNPMARENAAVAIYNEHIYPVFSNQRCRQNVTGIPDDLELAKKHVAVFAEQCY